MHLKIGKLAWLVFPLLLGCASFEPTWTLPNPFTRGSDEDDPLFARTKAARINEIRRIADDAREMSPAARMTASTELAERLQHETDSTLRIEIVNALGAMPTPAATEGLRYATQDANTKVRLTACRALGRMQSAEALAILASVVQADSDLDVRLAATQAIGNFESPDAVRALAIAIEDPDPALQFTAVQSMRQVHSQDLGNSLSAWKELARRVNSESTENRF